MKRLDSYILAQLLGALGFFVLVFTGVVWLTQAVRLIDTVIASGQGAAIFLTFSALVMPQVLVIVLPLSAIGAALYAINRLYGESELVVMMAAGLGPLGLIRPVAIFGAIMGAAMAAVLLFLVPAAGTALADRTQAIRSDLAQALIVERQFIHPMPGITLFISDTSRQGEMAGIFLNDQREFARPVTYSAEHAILVREGMEARLVMRDGVAITLDARSQQINTVKFDQFVFDLSDLLREQSTRIPRPSEYWVLDLLRPSAEMLASGRYSAGDFVAEGHYKLTLPILAVIYPLIALVTILAGGYRRSGFGRRVIVAVGVALILQILTFATRSQVQERPMAWPLMYLPILLGFAYVAILTRRLSRPRRRSRRAEAPA
ncbi:LptF/LptG family permease [Amaricoccus solimangrovi]|uniref:LptF/LptG family permease n=1 Tax=Amaricoccus solimangrovi TaxID=2589815 RepID=UPI0015E3BF4A|nr:LptF/LptG family permease [Amaricoccus solimangrovi]